MNYCWNIGRPTPNGREIFELYSGMRQVLEIEVEQSGFGEEPGVECSSPGGCFDARAFDEAVTNGYGLLVEERGLLTGLRLEITGLDHDPLKDSRKLRPPKMRTGTEFLNWDRYLSRRESARLATILDSQIQQIGAVCGRYHSTGLRIERVRSRQRLRSWFRRRQSVPRLAPDVVRILHEE